MKNIEIEIHQEKNCAWCELPNGSIMYGKDKEEISSTLDLISKLNKEIR